MKKAIAFALVIIVAFGWYVTLFGIGSIEPLKNQIKLGLDLKGGISVLMQAETDLTGSDLKQLMEQTQLVIEKRVNEMGLSEPVITIEGEDKIRVELPGAKNAQEVIDAIGKTAQLEFLLADDTLVVDGSMVKNASLGKDEYGKPAIDLTFTSEGAKAFEEGTRKAAEGVISSVDGKLSNTIAIVLDDQIISSPNAGKVIFGGNAQITGIFTEEEARSDAMLIRGGSLPVSLTEVDSSGVPASLGIDSLKWSVIAGAIGVFLVFTIMLVMYRVMGVAANIALLLYILIVIWVMVSLGSVLTLPGIAGIILAIGMAVDANVIIFARVKEEIINGKSIRVAIDSGFKRAMATIIDSQVTTIIAGVVLYQLGTGPVKGFAMTLMIGIVASVFTAVVVTNVCLQVISESKFMANKKYFGIKEEKSIESKLNFPYIKHRKKYYLIIIAFIILGIGLGFVRGFNFGIDFTGGTKLIIEMEKEVPLAQVESLLDEYNISGEVNYSGDENKKIVIKTTDAIENTERSALIADIKEEFNLTGEDPYFSMFGPSIGDLLKKNAIKAVAIAAFCMFIYILIRFEWKFGVAAIVGVLTDVLILISFYGLFNIQIDSPFIASILTVVGYSINDTIVVFDRVRENLGLMKKSKMDELINTSINQTLVRSMMTSITTIIVIAPLLIFAGSSIREFALPLMIGILAGCGSSIFICSPIYYELCQITKGSKYKRKKAAKTQ